MSRRYPIIPRVANHIQAAPELKHSLIASLEGLYNPQNNCVLFVGVPPEIRNRIFSFALYSYDDKSRPYPDHAFYNRPGYRYHQCINTALLETCRRIYSETHDLPISQNEHIFWCSASRGPSPFCDDPARYFTRFTEEQKAAVVQVHFFTQLFWLEGGTFQKVCQLKDMHPKIMKITIRHGDWWFWERNAPLVMKSQWRNNLKSIQGLKTLEVELEALERDKDQLETIVKNMLSWRIPLTDSQSLTTEGNPINREKYMGQSAFADNLGYGAYYRTENNRWIGFTTGISPLSNIQSQLPYVVSTLRWNAKSLES